MTTEHDGSDMDCVECGGFIDLERPAPRGLCRSCEAAERADREDFAAPADRGPGRRGSGEAVDA